MRLLTLTLAMTLGATLLVAEEDTRKTDERLNDAASLFTEIMTAPDRALPQRVLDKASCVVLVPGMMKGAFMVGGKYGRGYAVCRAANGLGMLLYQGAEALELWTGRTAPTAIMREALEENVYGATRAGH